MQTSNSFMFYVLLFISFRCISFSGTDAAFMLQFLLLTLLLLLHLRIVLVDFVVSTSLCAWFFSPLILVALYFCFGIVFESFLSAHFTCGSPPHIPACAHRLHGVHLACAVTTVSIVQNLLSLGINVKIDVRS